MDFVPKGNRQPRLFDPSPATVEYLENAIWNLAGRYGDTPKRVSPRQWSFMSPPIEGKSLRGLLYSVYSFQTLCIPGADEAAVSSGKFIRRSLELEKNASAGVNEIYQSLWSRCQLTFSMGPGGLDDGLLP